MQSETYPSPSNHFKRRAFDKHERISKQTLKEAIMTPTPYNIKGEKMIFSPLRRVYIPLQTVGIRMSYQKKDGRYDHSLPKIPYDIGEIYNEIAQSISALRNALIERTNEGALVWSTFSGLSFDMEEVTTEKNGRALPPYIATMSLDLWLVQHTGFSALINAEMELVGFIKESCNYNNSSMRFYEAVETDKIYFDFIKKKTDGLI